MAADSSPCKLTHISPATVAPSSTHGNQRCVPALQAVSNEGLVHFDLKCDNVFVQPLPGVSEQDFWSPVGDAPPFNVVLGDFGDSHDFRQAGRHPISL